MVIGALAAAMAGDESKVRDRSCGSKPNRAAYQLIFRDLERKEKPSYPPTEDAGDLEREEGEGGGFFKREKRGKECTYMNNCIYIYTNATAKMEFC